MLGLGVAATIGADISYGAAYGTTGAVISAWPVIAFIGAAELLMISIRAIRSNLNVGQPRAQRVRAHLATVVHN